jgi:hypothetical protein
MDRLRRNLSRESHRKKPPTLSRSGRTERRGNESGPPEIRRLSHPLNEELLPSDLSLGIYMLWRAV